MSIQSKGATLASVAAVLALSMSPVFAAAHSGAAPAATKQPAGSFGAAIGASDKVHCYGAMSCKGNSDCKTAEHSCKGQNACKGHGFKGISAKACLDAGGIISDLKGK